MTGSKRDAYAKDEWNLKLQKLLRSAFDRQQRIFGVCFGCQTMAIVLGGRVGKMCCAQTFLCMQIVSMLHEVLTATLPAS